MSESSGAGGSGGSGGAPAAAPGSTPAVTPPTPAPLGQSPRLRGGISERDAIGAHLQLRRTRKAAPGNGADAAAPRQAAPVNAPPAMRTPSDPAPPASNGHAAPPNGAAAANAAGDDPIDKLIATMRAPRPAEGTPAGQNQPAPAASGEATPQAGPIRLTIDGRSADFTPEQLTNAVRMASDYTKKAQQLAAVAKQVNDRQAAIEQMMPVLVPEIQRQIAALDQQMQAEPDWQKLAATDPAEYQRQDAAWKAAQAERARLAQLQGMQAQETRQQQQQHLAEGHKMLVKEIPGWENAATRAHFQERMRAWALGQGFTAAEMDNVTEAKHVVALWKAMAFDRLLQTSGDAPRVPNVSGNGRAPQPPQHGDVARTFQQRPTQQNAVAAYAAIRAARKAHN